MLRAFVILVKDFNPDLLFNFATLKPQALLLSNYFRKKNCHNECFIGYGTRVWECLFRYNKKREKNCPSFRKTYDGTGSYIIIKLLKKDKSVLAVENNSKYQSAGSSVSRKKLPSFCSMKTKEAQTQTDFISDCTLDRFLHLYNSIKFAELSKLMGIMINGYGSLPNNTDRNEVCFFEWIQN